MNKKSFVRGGYCLLVFLLAIIYALPENAYAITDNQPTAYNSEIDFDESDENTISTSTFTIPEGMTIIGDEAFSGCESIVNVSIPASVTSIGDNAFYGCTNLSNVYYSGVLTQLNSLESSTNDSLKIAANSSSNSLLYVEVGGMGIKNGEIYYARNAKKIRSVEGILYKISSGNQIGLKDYSNASLLIYLTKDGKTYTAKKITSGSFSPKEDYFFAFTINFDSIQQSTSGIYLLNYSPELIDGYPFVYSDTLLGGGGEEPSNSFNFSVELGGMGLKSGELYYAKNAKKIRSNEGILYKLTAGQSISLFDYSEASLLLYFTQDGESFTAKKLTSGVYKSTSDTYVAFSINFTSKLDNTDKISLLNFNPANESGKYEFRIGEIREPEPTVHESKASFAIIDDDGHEVVYTYLYPWALNYKVPFTDAIPTKLVSNSKGTSFLTVNQVQEMYQSGLVTIGSHTVNHTPNLSKCDDPIFELSESKRTIESWGIPCRHIIYPNGVVTDEVLSFIDQYYDYGYLAGGAQRNGIHIQNRINYSPIDKYHIMRTALNGSMSEEEIELVKSRINECIEKGGLMIFMIHIGQSATVQEDLDMYTSIVSYIRSKGFDIEPLDIVMDRFN